MSEICNTLLLEWSLEMICSRVHIFTQSVGLGVTGGWLRHGGKCRTLSLPQRKWGWGRVTSQLQPITAIVIRRDTGQFLKNKLEILNFMRNILFWSVFNSCRWEKKATLYWKSNLVQGLPIYNIGCRPTTYFYNWETDCKLLQDAADPCCNVFKLH